MRQLRHLLICLAAVALVAINAKADQETVVVGWTDVPPLFRLGDQTEPEGFSVDFIWRVSEIADLPITMRRFHSMPATAQAQIDGVSEMVPGIARLPGLVSTNLFSQPIATTRVRLFVRVEDARDAELSNPAGRKIGTVPPALGSGPSELLERNINVPLPSAGTALIKLLSGEIDGILFSEEVMMSEAHAGRLDHRIKAVGSPLREVDRVVAIHENRAHLLERVNAAITELEASGELAEMRRRWFLEAPPPPPDILTVGVNHFPPYNIVQDDGSFTGFSVETIRDLAELAGLRLEFKQITPEEWRQGPAPERYDIITQAGISDERMERMDFTLPIERFPFSIFMREGEAFDIKSLDDLFGRRVGVERVNLARRLAEAHGLPDLTIADGQEALLSALLNYKVDAILYPTKAMRGLIRQEGFGDRIEEIKPPFFVSDRAPALRFGLGEVRERLNAVIPGYLVSERHATLIDAWFGEHVYWTDQRVRTLILLGSGLILLLAGLLVASMLWRRHQIDRERRRFAAEIVSHLPVGVMLISAEGIIDFANLQDVDEIWRKHPNFVRGQDFRNAVRQLVEQGWVDTKGQSPAELAETMATDVLKNDHTREVQFTDGRVIRRTTRKLENGSTLLVREDVTEYREQLRQIESLNTNLAVQIKHANLTNEELRAFAYATSHDLKAPTNTLIMTLETLADDLDSKLTTDDRQLLDVAKRTLSGMRTLIDDILAYTNTIGSPPTCERVDLNQVAANVLEALKADIEVNAAEIRLSSLPSLKASPTQMHQLVQNLVSNAVKFHAKGKPPAIEVEPADAPPGYVGFKISDNGIGIPPEQRDKVFQLFGRLNRNSTYAGTGLGLAICQRIALNHGGRINLESTPGEGTTFTVQLKESDDDSPSHPH